MCLYVDVKSTEKFLSKHRNHTYVTCYKKIWKTMNALHKTNYVYKVGENKSDSRSRGVCKKNLKEIHRGIHVWLNKPQDDLLNSSEKMYIRVLCKVEDLIAVGYSGYAVFRKVTLPKNFMVK